MKTALVAKASGIAFAAVAGMAAMPAAAQEAGDIQVKLLATGVLPDGEIEEVNLDLVGLPAGTQTEANDNVVPTLAIEYFATPNISVETICCVTQHDVDAVSGAPGAELVSDGLLLPATVTAKFHFNPGGISPYVGAGGAYFIWLDDEPGEAAVALGADDFSLSDEFGFVLQAGVDVPVGDSGLALSVDAKRYFIDTTATWFANGDPVIQTEHNLDPWVVSAGVAFRF
ncbi:OmpW/AlkL family protein [Aurantiacibacter poecillastricola]|uniref:OmpW/AlkL family protein n=1 Tax=Aurantiacibacter poecillastricola TaxID=3064385 RepID=UPI00273FF523|nr:OmpW family outer membrane protein [Aurantiacibacter sp. 219JJ12-13]MDP5261376.1 OmpW family outer membrane protein [Aurantiacibacter sp. 219JJ12-13]